MDDVKALDYIMTAVKEKMHKEIKRRQAVQLHNAMLAAVTRSATNQS